MVAECSRRGRFDQRPCTRAHARCLARREGPVLGSALPTGYFQARASSCAFRRRGSARPRRRRFLSAIGPWSFRSGDDGCARRNSAPHPIVPEGRTTRVGKTPVNGVEQGEINVGPVVCQPVQNQPAARGRCCERHAVRPVPDPRPPADVAVAVPFANESGFGRRDPGSVRWLARCS